MYELEDTEVADRVALYFDMTFGYALYLTNDHHLAQDIVQSVAEKVLKSTTVCAKSLGESYFKTAVMNLWTDIRKSPAHNRQSVLELDTAAAAVKIDSTKNADDRMLLEQLKQLLTADEWKLANMVAEGYTNNEIQKEFGCNRRVVYSKLHAIKKKVQGKL